MSEPVRLSACVITLDEERDLPGCLASIAFCDEVVVVDSGSTDATREIARAAGARVVEQPWLGFPAQRNVGLDAAAGEWVLEIDADERVSPALRGEIEAFLAAPPPGIDLVALPRREHIAGHRLGPSAKFPNYCHRLLRRGAYRHDEQRTVHEGIVPAGPVHPAAGELEHLTARSWAQAIADTRRYADLDAQQLMAGRDARTVALGLVARPLVKFAYRVAVDGAWRDGPAGLAKVALDCWGDARVWWGHARGAAKTGVSGAAAGEHYGSRRWPRGDPHVALLALGARATAEATSWASAADGLDVAVITDAPGTDGHARVRPVDGRTPAAALRALDAEEQLRTLDALVCFGPVARLTARAAPGGLRGIVPPADGARTSPEQLALAVQAARAERGS